MEMVKRSAWSARLATVGSTVLALTLASNAAHAAVYSYVDWTAADASDGTATGTITLPDASTVTVTFQAFNADLTAGTLYGAQTSPGIDYWNPSAPYVSAQVENAPPLTDILQLSGGLDQSYKVTLSEPIKDPIMAVVSLGAPSTRCTYDFDSPFTIVSQGAGYWGGGATSLSPLAGDILEGYEGHGTIQFIGTFTTFSWTVPTTETWHGFTFGIRTTERIEPTPSEGGAGGVGGEAGAAGAGAVVNEGGVANGTAGAASSGAGAIADGLAGESSGGASGAGSGGASSGGALELGGSSSVGGDGDDDRASTREDAGCSCEVAGVGGDGSLALAVMLGMGWLAHKRRARR